MKWKLLRHFYPTESWGNPEKMDFMLLVMLDQFRSSLPTGYKVKIHRGYSGDNQGSLHYDAKAIDFHVIGCPFIEAEYHLKNFLIRRGLMIEVELGIYPDWHDPGFHLGLQYKGGTWGAKYIKNLHGQTEQCYFGYNEVLKYAKDKFAVV